MSVCPPTSLHVRAVAAHAARKAPQWGLSFFERPPENESGRLGGANSPHFLRPMMVEWLFVMHDNPVSNDALARLLSVEIRTATSGSNPGRSYSSSSCGGLSRLSHPRRLSAAECPLTGVKRNAPVSHRLAEAARSNSQTGIASGGRPGGARRSLSQAVR